MKARYIVITILILAALAYLLPRTAVKELTVKIVGFDWTTTTPVERYQLIQDSGSYVPDGATETGRHVERTYSHDPMCDLKADCPYSDSTTFFYQYYGWSEVGTVSIGGHDNNPQFFGDICYDKYNCTNKSAAVIDKMSVNLIDTSGDLLFYDAKNKLEFQSFQYDTVHQLGLNIFGGVVYLH